MTAVTDEGTGDVDSERRAALRALARAAGVVAGGCAAGLPLAVWSSAAAAADTALDVQILQTASSLETLLLGLYAGALGTGPQGKEAPPAKALATMVNTVARDTLVRFLTETHAQHREHLLAFQTLTTQLGGQEQHEPNPKFTSGAAAADVSSPLRFLDYAAVLEKIATDTYVLDLTMAENVKAKEALAAVMAVEAQHLAVLRAFGALLRDNTPQLVKIPIGDDIGELPATLVGVAYPEAMEDVTSSSSVAEPESGAVG
jgi:Ferritin-like domain